MFYLWLVTWFLLELIPHLTRLAFWHIYYQTIQRFRISWESALKKVLMKVTYIVKTWYKLKFRIADLGNPKEIDQSTLKHFRYGKLVLKETLRLYPISVGIGRVLQSDEIIGGYMVRTLTWLQRYESHQCFQHLSFFRRVYSRSSWITTWLYRRIILLKIRPLQWSQNITNQSMIQKHKKSICQNVSQRESISVLK